MPQSSRALPLLAVHVHPERPVRVTARHGLVVMGKGLIDVACDDAPAFVAQDGPATHQPVNAVADDVALPPEAVADCCDCHQVATAPRTICSDTPSPCRAAFYDPPQPLDLFGCLRIQSRRQRRSINQSINNVGGISALIPTKNVPGNSHRSVMALIHELMPMDCFGGVMEYVFLPDQVGC